MRQLKNQVDIRQYMSTWCDAIVWQVFLVEIMSDLNFNSEVNIAIYSSTYYFLLLYKPCAICNDTRIVALNSTQSTC
uniref:Uncharacterized protein n=1 Tax=Arundo donax TaxID=35708 RepID=A0A0A9GI06_ARUDO